MYNVDNRGGKMMKETISKDPGVKKLSEIEEEKIEWLVPEYIPRGSISVITQLGENPWACPWDETIILSAR